jgi:hypothetical protein
MLKNRRRSLSASRTFDQTVNLVGKIGASLRLSSRMKKAKVKKAIYIYSNTYHLFVQFNNFILVIYRKQASQLLLLDTWKWSTTATNNINGVQEAPKVGSDRVNAVPAWMLNDDAPHGQTSTTLSVLIIASLN